MSRPVGLSIILVGGVFTTEDGATVDRGSPWRATALVRSSTARCRGLTCGGRRCAPCRPIAQDAGGGYALVDGPHQVFDLASDGGIKRVSLADLLAVGSSEAHWRFPYDERPNVASIRDVYGDAAALVDVAQAGKSGAEVLSSFSARVRWNPSLVLVVPHTHALGEFFGHVALAGQERRPRPPTATPTVPATSLGREPDPLNYAASVPVHAQFKVTGLIKDGAWQDPSGLEAARELLQARYDLTLGIWDLAPNPTLRTTLLTSLRSGPPLRSRFPCRRPPVPERNPNSRPRNPPGRSGPLAFSQSSILAGYAGEGAGFFAYILAEGDPTRSEPVSPPLALAIAVEDPVDGTPAVADPRDLHARWPSADWWPARRSSRDRRPIRL